MSTYLLGYGKYARLNASGADASGQRTLVAGGTQGIGAGVALRMALAGSEVWLVGRSQERAEALLSKLREASQEARRRQGSKGGAATTATEPEHAFFKADLSSVSEIKRVSSDIISAAGSRGIDHLVCTQGGPPNGTFKPSTEAGGPEKGFAVQVFSRFALAELLSDAGAIKHSIAFVAAPGGGAKTPVDAADLDFSRAIKEGKVKEGFFAIPKVGQRDSSVLDSVSQTLAEKNPQLSILHLFPGIVHTSAVSNQGFPTPLVWLFNIAGPIVANKAGPGGYAEVPTYLLAHPEGRRYLRSGEANLFGASLARLELSANVKDKEVRKSIWDGLYKWLK